MSALTQYFTSSIGKKTLVAVTGIMLIGFIVGHLIGNLQFFLPAAYIDAYGHKLQSLGPFLWVIRLGLLAVIAVHIFATVALTIENRKARPQKYAVTAHRRSTAASRTMIMSGLILLAFIIFHLLHFTVRVTDPEIARITASFETVSAGDPEAFYPVKQMMIIGFQRWYVSLFYIVGMFLLAMHLSHGTSSFFQTLGLRSRKLEKALDVGARMFAWLIFAGYVSIPLSVLLGIVRHP